ncbi:MAG: hypothetical protein HRT74_06845 [Flavobacteriales bacterium]|nr:hypothetical protein [Flavobacteriales bacterium]
MKAILSLFAAVITLFICLNWSCASTKATTQGVIVYDVSFPFLKEKVLLNVFPEEMVVSYKGNQTHGSLKSVGGIVTTEFIANEENRTFSQLLKEFGNRYYMELDQTEVNRYVGTFPEIILESTGETEVVAGYECKKTIATFVQDSVPPVVLYHTDEIGLDHPNWFTQYSDIEGVLLGYEVEQYGMRMKLLARSVEQKEVDESLFDISKNYQRISYEKMEVVIDSLMGNMSSGELF